MTKATLPVRVFQDGRPSTVEEFAALPEAAFGKKRHELTEADRANGFIVIDGVPVYVSGPNIRAVEVAENPEFVAHFAGDLEGYRDEDGVYWRLVQRSDGEWFRCRM